MNIENNFFNYATGELSQDAFLCWIFSFAYKSSNSDENIKACAIDFLKAFVPELEKESKIYLSCLPEKQVEKVDVLLTVNDKYKIILEDKTNTSEHDDQLKRYYNNIKELYPNYDVKGIYFKIGFQSDRSVIDKSNYKFFGLEDIYTILEKHIDNIDNDIFKDYYEYLKNLKIEISKFKTLPVNKWSWAQINGFYDYIQSKPYGGMKCNYGYVNRPSGGFYGMWIYNSVYEEYDNNKYELYLQCEFVNNNLNICYKASNKNDLKIYAKAREHFIFRNNIDVANNHGFAKPPTRFGCGITVTFGLYKDYELITDYKDAELKIHAAIDDFNNMIKELGIKS